MTEQDTIELGQWIERLTEDDYQLAGHILAGHGDLWKPDTIMAPGGSPYLYRWHVIPRNDYANVYFHLQVASDPERPLHDHPWDNQSVILAGGYDEAYSRFNPSGALPPPSMRRLRQGDVATRAATEAHRLILPPGIPYTMTLFSTGPKVREWGFWYPDGWHHSERHVADREGRSVHVQEEVQHAAE